MPIIVACPKCNGQLRVADDLIGRKVRCPACNAIFDANQRPEAGTSLPVPPPGSPSLELDRPIETQPIDPWKHLNLELDPAPADKVSPTPMPVAPQGARELDETPESSEPDTPRKRRPRPRLNDDHDDLRACPECGRMNHRAAWRCVSCNVELRGTSSEEDDDEEWEDRPYRRRPARRDWEPHRAGFILAMGITSVALPFVCWPLTPLGVVPGLIAWILGSADLKKIRAGTMDPEGHSSTQGGWICGIIGTCISVLGLLLCGGFVSLVWYVDVQSSRNNPRPGFVAPPPQAPRPNLPQ